jgi:hypothetical protein
MKTKRHEDKLGYNPDTIPRKPNTRYVVSKQSRALFDKVVGRSKNVKRIDECGDDAHKWAKLFVETVVKNNIKIDVGYMIGWFANVIERSNDVRNRNKG